MIVFLQNAWSPIYAGHEWPRSSWLRALKRSVTGRELQKADINLDACWNTTQQVAQRSHQVCQADLHYMYHVIQYELEHDFNDLQKDGLIVACGKQATEAVLEIWDENIVSIPHPAWRLLKKETYNLIKIELEIIHNRVRQAIGEKERWRIDQAFNDNNKVCLDITFLPRTSMKF